MLLSRDVIGTFLLPKSTKSEVVGETAYSSGVAAVYRGLTASLLAVSSVATRSKLHWVSCEELEDNESMGFQILTEIKSTFP